MGKIFLNSVFWSSFGQAGYVLIGLISNVFLVRILTPDDFGLVGISVFFVGISNVLIEGGFGGALVRKKNVTEEDYSTVFIVNLIISIALTLIIIFLSSDISEYYNLPKLKPVLQTLSSLLIIYAFTIIQNVKLIRAMEFKLIGIYKLITVFISSVISIYFAYNGYGVWSIVVFQVLSPFLMMVLFWIKVGGVNNWFVFSKKSFHEVFNFGIYTTLSSLLNVGFDNVYQLIIGKYFSINKVGLYYQAKKLYQAPEGICKNVIQQVYYSHLSKYQGNKDNFVKKFNLIFKNSAVIIGFTGALIYIYSQDIVLLLYGDKWFDSVSFLKLFVIAGFFYLQELISRNVFKIYKETRLIFFLEVFKKVIQLATIYFGIYYKSINLLLYGLIFVSVISFVSNLHFSFRILHHSYRGVFIEINKIIFATIFSVFVFVKIVDSVSCFLFNARLVLIPVFLIIYFLILKFVNIINNEQLNEVKSFFSKD